ncbi:hypothetical protein JTB14_002568 [Gonioctena quinquepunctata]|nr:hypothetical protein JTB14_002568 [Gonioctena quinquepunctata]
MIVHDKFINLERLDNDPDELFDLLDDGGSDLEIEENEQETGNFVISYLDEQKVLEGNIIPERTPLESDSDSVSHFHKSSWKKDVFQSKSDPMDDIIINIDGTATIMSNRVKGCNFRKDKEMNRGNYDQFARSDEKNCITKWMDNKSVLMISTTYGTEHDCVVQRLKLGEYLITGTKKRTVQETNVKEDGNPQPDTTRRQAALLPSDNKRYDGFKHWHSNDQLKDPLSCRNRECDSRSRIRFINCNVHLCMNESRNCFMSFHQKNN